MTWVPYFCVISKLKQRERERIGVGWYLSPFSDLQILFYYEIQLVVRNAQSD
jgi:hypothetical protein